MIECYAGLIGGGKTYSAVMRMLSYMAKGGCVVSNIKLHLDPWKCENPLYSGRFNKEFNAMGCKEYMRKMFDWEYQDGQYRYIDNKHLAIEGITAKLPEGLMDLPVLLVWDEGADFWDSEDRDNADKEFLSLLRHSRKLGMDFLFIIQDFSELNKRIRNQTAYVWRFIDMSTFRIPGLGIGVGWVPMLRNQIRVLQFQRGQYELNKGSVEPCFTGWIDKKQEIFACYSTEALHTGIEVLRGEKVDFRGKGSRNSAQDFPIVSFASGFSCFYLVMILGGVL